MAQSKASKVLHGSLRKDIGFLQSGTAVSCGELISGNEQI
jgi:hypothetical protein